MLKHELYKRKQQLKRFFKNLTFKPYYKRTNRYWVQELEVKSVKKRLDYFIELVHPDHNCWFSPYTLKNTIEKYSSLKVKKIYLLENDRMVCCEAVKDE